MDSRLPQSPFLYPILDSTYSADLIKDGEQLIRAGAQIFQVRAKSLSRRALYDVVAGLAPLCSSRGVSLIVNDAVDVAMVTTATGVHLGQEDFPADVCRRILPEKIIGLSTHNPEQWNNASSSPVDYIAVGPVYASPTKPDAGSILGISCVRQICGMKTKPVVAIGGIKRENFKELIEAGIDGIAIISELYRGESVYDTASALLDCIGKG